ncbi:endonuclease domain-containing protein [Streptomyces sp. NPDC046925]|uniref:endonuclease domain-containing protein n=1 Tax=Streptomyces sp. NPDC046925 TaxID=3155375 RepID=UPI003406F8B5
MPSKKPRCKDCPPDSRRPAPNPGPRCATHHREEKKRRRGAKAENQVQTRFGLAPGDYDKLYRLQGGACAICTRGKGISKRLAVDHDHTCCAGPTSCGKCVRGLVCGRCNSLLAHARDELAFFDRAAAYLINPPARRLRGEAT